MDISDLVYIDENGFHTTDFPTVLNMLQQNYLSIYGQDTDIDPDTQDGQWIANQAQQIFDTINIAQATYNAFSPITAQGAGLSQVVQINGIQREVSSNSTADLTIVGQSGTVLGTENNPAIAIDVLQQKWDIPIGTIIPSGGSITVTAVSEISGAISAAANTINKIYTPTLGWQTVNNVAPATPGAPVETDAELRIRQQNSVANPSLTVIEGTAGGIANLNGVQKVQPYENDTESTDGNGLPAHSICMVVLGGDDMDIANEIALHKTPGTTTYGNTSELVVDSRGMPLTINFQRPTTAEIQVQITLSAGSAWTTDYEPTIANAIASLINSNKIGQTVIISLLYAPAYLNGTAPSNAYNITTIEIGKNSGGLGTSNIPLDFDENAVVDPTVDVTFVVT